MLIFGFLLQRLSPHGELTRSAGGAGRGAAAPELPTPGSRQPGARSRAAVRLHPLLIALTSGGFSGCWQKDSG